MFTNRRLDKAFEKAINIDFNDSSKYIILSDLHRGDNSISDEFAHNQNIVLHALNYYYDNGYTYIENGDGDELWEHAKFRHIRFAHSDVFDVLSKFHNTNRLIMLYGNHNKSLQDKRYIEKNMEKVLDPYNDKEMYVFPGLEVYESVILNYTPTNKKLFLVHGHQGDFFNDQLWLFARFMLRYFWRYMHVVGFRNPASPAKSYSKRHKIERKYVKWLKDQDLMLIVGHTHRPKFSYPNQNLYFNSGSCVRPRNITGIEIVNGTIALIEWRIWPDEDGCLQVVKRIIHGPIPFNAYM